MQLLKNVWSLVAQVFVYGQRLAGHKLVRFGALTENDSVIKNMAKYTQNLTEKHKIPDLKLG